MPETLPDPKGITNIGDPRDEKTISLKPFSQWKQESQDQTGNPLSDIDSLVGYSNYQRLESLKSNKYSEDAEKKIQSALYAQLNKRGLLQGKTDEERKQLEDSIFSVPEPSFDDSVRAVTAAFPSATPDSTDPDLAAFARYRDFGKNLGDEVGQDEQAGLEEAKAAATPAISKLYDKAQRERVKKGDIPIAIVTNYDEEGKPYKSFYAEDTGDTPAEVAVARALESGAIPPQAAFGAYSILQKIPGLGVNDIGMRNIQRAKAIARKASTFDEYSGLQDVINDYGDYLIDKDKGDVDAEDETFARQTEARFASYLGMITEDSEEPPTGNSVKQALEELAFDTAVQNGKVKFDEDNLSNNIRFTSAGVPLVHPALVGNSEYFEKALDTKPDLTSAQKRQLQANRKTFLANNFERYDELLSESPTQGEDWRAYRNKARSENRDDFEIIDSYLKNPNSFREFSSRMSGIGSSIIDAFGTLGATLPALAGAEWAQDYLTETAKKNSARRQVAEAFGRPFGVEQDILEQAAPIVADLAATALLSSVTGGVGGAAYLALRQGGNVTGKAVGKALTASMLQRSVFMEAGEDAATAAARLTDVGDLIKKGTSAADAERVIAGYNRVVQSKLNLVAPLFLTSANRSAGGMYGAVYNALPDTLSKEERHDQALGAALMSGATTGLITSAFSLAGLGGLENALLKGATAGQLVRALKKVGGPKAVADITNGDFKAALAKGMQETFVKLGLNAGARAKAVGVNVGSEAVEEGVDEFISTFINDAFTGQDTPLLKRLQTGLHAAFIGGVYGGAIPGIKSAVKQFTPTTDTEQAAFAGARAELAKSVSEKLEASGSPLAAQAVSAILSGDVTSSILAAGPSQRGGAGTAFAGKTRAQVVDELIASTSATAAQGEQLVMGSILRDAEGTRPAPVEEAPPSPSPAPGAEPAAAAAPAEAGISQGEGVISIPLPTPTAPSALASSGIEPDIDLGPIPPSGRSFTAADFGTRGVVMGGGTEAQLESMLLAALNSGREVTLNQEGKSRRMAARDGNKIVDQDGNPWGVTGTLYSGGQFVVGPAITPTPTPTPGSAQAVADLTAAVPTLDLEEAAESELTQQNFDFFDDASSIRTAVVPTPGSIEGVQRNIPSAPKAISAANGPIEKRADDLRLEPEKAQAYKATLGKKDAKTFDNRLKKWDAKESSLQSASRRAFKYNQKPQLPFVQDAVNNAGIPDAANAAGVTIVFVDGPGAVSKFTGRPPVKTGKTAITTVTNGVPVVVVDESTVQGKTEQQITESIRAAMFHASVLRAAAETGAYTSEPAATVLQENGLLGKATAANSSVSDSVSPAEQLSKTLFAVANSEVSLDLNDHPTLRAFIQRVLPVLSFRLTGPTADPEISQSVENLQTLLEEGEVVGTATPTPAPALSPASPKLQPRFVYGEDQTMTEQQKDVSARIYEILVSLNAIPRNLEIIFDFSVPAAFRVEGGYLYVNPSEVTRGLIGNNLLTTGSDGVTRITDIPRARQVLREELAHEQIHMATDRALTVDERNRLIAGFTTEELVEMAHAYYAGNTALRDADIAILNDPTHPKFSEVRARIGDEKIRADVQSLMRGETSEESLAALSENTARKSMYLRYLTKAQFLFRRKLRASGDAAYSAALKRIANAKRDMENGYIPAQHSHGGIFSPDRPYAGLAQIMRAGMYMNPNAELPEDFDLDGLEVEPGEDRVEVPVNEAAILSDTEAANMAFSMFGVGAKIETPEETKSKVLGGATVGTRYPKVKKVKPAAERGVNPDNQITLEAAAVDKKSYFKNALVLASYPAVRGTIRRQLADATMLDKLRGGMSDAKWAVTERKIKAALETSPTVLKAADDFKQKEDVVETLKKREDAKAALNAFVEGLSSNKNPKNLDNNARDAYWSWFFKQINFTGTGMLTPNKFGKSSLPKVRDALVELTTSGQINALNKSYKPEKGVKKWTPTKEDLQKIVELKDIRDAATIGTDKVKAKTKQVRVDIGKNLVLYSAPGTADSLIDDDVARIIYQSLDEIGEQNLSILHDIFPESVRIYAKLWYDGANILARQLSGNAASQTVGDKKVSAVDDVFGGGFVAKGFNERSLEKAAAILAVFSPQKDWFMNVSLAHRTMDVLFRAYTRPQKMTWTPEMSTQLLKRAGEPEETEDDNGKITYSGGATPVYKEGTDEFALDAFGNRLFINFDPGPSRDIAGAINNALEGKTFEEIGTMSVSYPDPENPNKTKTLNGTALQARFVRMFSEVNHAQNYPAINPNGQVGGYSKSPDSGKNIKIAWGSYNTIEKAIRIYTTIGSSENYENDAILNVISDELGGQHKVRSFYNNIVNPGMDGHVTMDTHAIAAILGKPLSGAMAEVSHNFGSNFVGGSGLEGISGTYAANAEAYRNVALSKGLLARELQSITWESVRLFFTAKFKRTAGVARINAVWESYADRTEFVPEPTDADPNPAPVMIDTIEDAWNQIIRVVWGSSKKGKPVPTLAQLKEYAKIEYLNSVKAEDYNGIGFPSWDTTDIAEKMIALEGEKAIEDVNSQFVDIGTYLSDTSTRYSQFGQSKEQQSEQALLGLLRATKAEGIPIDRTNAALRREIERLNTQIQGETTDELLEAAVKAKLALSAYRYHGSKIGYSDYASALPASGSDPAAAPAKFGPLEPEFIEFLANAPTLQSEIRNNPVGVSLKSEGEKQLIGYVVSPRKGTEREIPANFTDDDLRLYIVEHADILSMPGARISGKFDQDSKQFLLNVTFAVQNAEDALTTALAADQESIWDLQNNYEIRTKNPNGTAALPRVIDGRDASRVLAEVVPTISDVALFASERSFRDTGRMVLPSDGGTETTGAAAGLDVPTSRIIAEAREVSLSDDAPGNSIQGGFGRTQRKGQEGPLGAFGKYVTGRFRKISSSQAREKMRGYEYNGAEHIVKLDNVSTSRVFKLARDPAAPFGYLEDRSKNPQSEYLSRLAVSNIFFEDNQRIENVVVDDNTGDVAGYLVSQPYYSKSRDLSRAEISEILATLGWLRYKQPSGQISLIKNAPTGAYFSKPVRLKDGSEGPRLYVADAHSENIYMEKTDDGQEILRAPDLMVGIWSEDPAVTDKFPSVAALLEQHPDPAEYGISVPSQLNAILAKDRFTSDLLQQLKRDAEEAARGDARFSQFGGALTEEDTRYLELAKDPVKNREELQRMVKEAAKAAGYVTKGFHGTNREFTKFSKRVFPKFPNAQEKIGFFFATNESYAGQYGDITMPVFLKGNFKEEPEGLINQIENEWTNQKAGTYVGNLKRKGYDGVFFGDGKVGEIAVFNPNQIKSADLVTYDRRGKVIPLSQRFDTGSQDIRYSQFGAQDTEYLAAVERGDTETLQRMVDVAARAVGVPTVGVNINDSGSDYTGMILSGEKTIETRDSKINGFRNYVGQRVAIVSTNKKANKGKAMVVGYVTVGEPVEYNTQQEFDADFDRHRVSGGNYAFKGYKIGYPMLDVEPIVPYAPPATRKAVIQTRPVVTPIEYDEQGNVIPLSQRFGDSGDIRYSQFGGLTATPEGKRHAELEAKFNSGTITKEETAEAQRLVEQRAKERGLGSLGTLFHGTKKRFTSFKSDRDSSKLIYFSKDREMAENYPRGTGGHRTPEPDVAERINKVRKESNELSNRLFEENPVGTGDSFDLALANRLFEQVHQFERDRLDGMTVSEADMAMGIRIIPAYLETQNLFDPRDNWREFLPTLLEVLGLRSENELVPQMVDAIKNGNYLIWEYPAVVDAVLSKYDAMLIQEDQGKEPRTIAVRNPNQIKSADPFTGVPLDQRFNPETSDIRYSQFGGALTKEQETLVAKYSTPVTEEETTAFKKAASNKFLARKPELAVAAVRMKNGEITAGDYAELVNILDPFVVKGADPVPTNEKIYEYMSKTAGGSPSSEKGRDKLAKIGAFREDGAQRIPNGKLVEFRIDIPTYEASVKATGGEDAVYSVTGHEPVSETATSVGKTIAHLGVAKVKNPQFITRAISGKGKTIQIAMGGGKFPLATIKGNYEAITELPDDINDPNVWTEAGYNPVRSSELVDVRSKKAVVDGTEAIMVGSRVFVRDAELQDRPTGITYGERYSQFGATDPKVLRHSELESKFNDGTITSKESKEAQRLVDEVAKSYGLINRSGYVDPLEILINSAPRNKWSSTFQEKFGIRIHPSLIKVREAGFMDETDFPEPMRDMATVVSVSSLLKREADSWGNDILDVITSPSAPVNRKTGLSDVIRNNIRKKVEKRNEAISRIQAQTSNLYSAAEILQIAESLPTLTQIEGDDMARSDVRRSSSKPFVGVPLNERFATGIGDTRYSQFGFSGRQPLLDRVMDFDADENTEYFADFLDVLEVAVHESGTYKSPVTFLERLFQGEFDPRYQRIKQTERAFSVGAAAFIDQERQALLEAVEEAYGSATDIAANSLISQAFGSTALPLSVDEVNALRESRKQRHLAAIAAATPEAVDARAQTLIASGMDALDAKIEAKNSIIQEGVLQANQDSLDEEIKARKVHSDKIVAAKNSALKKLEQQAPEVRTRVLRIRRFVDEQSRRISKSLGEGDPLRIVLDNQLGIYVTRSYQFFNDEGYRDALMDPKNKNYMTYEAEREAAREFLQNQFLETRTLELMEEKFGLDEDGAKQQAMAEIKERSVGKGVGDELMLRWLDSLTGGPVPEDTQRPQGRDDASMRVIANNLKQRKDVPKPLRDLLRELDEEQGIEQILRTATTVSAILANQKTLAKVYTWGRSNKNPEDRWLLTRAEYEALDYETKRTYEIFPVKNGGASIRNPLAGHYAPAALTEALDNLSTKEHVEAQRAASQRAINGAMDFAVKATGFSMAFNVLFSLGHYARNILGYTATAIGVGRPSLIYKSAPSLKREIGRILPKRLQSFLSMPDDKFNVERLRLVGLNIDNDSVNAGTLKDMLSGRVTLTDAQNQIKSLSEQAQSALGKAVQPIMDKLGELEAATETFFKIAYFYDTLETLEQARAEGVGKIGNVSVANLSNETALYHEAARQTLMVLPSHSQTMPLVTEFTKSGFGLMLAPFLRFKSEMIRTPINNMKLAMDEINSGNSVLRKRGVARMSGMVSVLAGSAMLPAIVSSVFGGLDDEEDEALRKTMPKYLRDHSFFYFEFGGQLKSIDFTYVNPYSGIGDAFNKLWRGAVKGDPMAPVEAITTFLKNNFLDDQILAGAVSALRENRDPTTGLPIYEDVDSAAVKAGKSLKFLGLEAYGPRVLTDAIKVVAAAKEGVNSPGYEVQDIVLNGMMPFRIHTLDVPQQFRRYLYEHQQQYQRAGNKLNVVLAKRAISPEDVAGAYDDMTHYKKLANEDLLRTALAFTGPTLGIPLADADSMMRDSGVSKQRIANLNDRVMDKTIPSKDFVDKLLRMPEGRARGQILYDHIQRKPRYFELEVAK